MLHRLKFRVYLWTFTSLPPRSSGVAFEKTMHMTTRSRRTAIPSPKTDLSLCWVPEVTHVCHSWRETALLASFLWTDINVEASTLWAAEFARRSRQCPITIVLESHHLRYEEWIRHPKAYEYTKTLLHENRHRIRGIRLED